MTTRWFVEVSPLDVDALKERYCVEALQWQQALQQARKLRGDRGPLSRFAIELLEVGYRATDPAVRLRYTVSRAPGDAPLTGSAAAPSSNGAVAPAPGAVPAPPSPVAVALAAEAARVAAATAKPPAAATAAAAAPATSPADEAKVIPPPQRTELAHGKKSAQSTSPAVPRPVRATTEEGEPGSSAPVARSPSVAPMAPSVKPAQGAFPVAAAVSARPASPVAAAPAALAAPAAVSAPPVVAAPAAVSAPPVVAAPAAVSAPPAVAAPAAVSAPPAVAAPAAVSAPPVVEAPAAVSAPPAVAAPAAVSAPPVVEAPAAVSAPAAVTAPSAIVVPALAPATRAGAATEEPVPSLPGLSLISRRAEEPKEGTPITYREYAFAVEPGLTPKELERYARAIWEQVRTTLASRTSGRFVQIALFDHRWSGRPERPPVAVLAWKDWRGDPVIQIRQGETAAAAAAPPVAAAQAAAAPAQAVAAPPAGSAQGAAAPSTATVEPISAPHVAAVVAAVTAAPTVTISAPPTAIDGAAPAPGGAIGAPGFPAPAVGSGAFPASGAPAAAPLPSAQPPPRGSIRPLAPVETAGGRRGPSEDLISELFEEMHQLHFMPDIVTGAEYVLNVLGRVLPCDGVLVHVFDINTRQFIVVRAIGPTSKNALLHRTPDTFAMFRETFRRARTLSFPNAATDESFHDGRWERAGVAPRVALCGAVQQGGRYLGIIELANPQGGDTFHDSEVNAVDYICEQFADFVASRPLVLDDDAIVPKA